MTENKKHNKKHNRISRKKAIKRNYCCFGCVGGVYFFYKADCNLKNLNLGQKDERNIRKYYCKNGQGCDTGIGYAFEDVFYRRYKANGIDIHQVEMMPNGADFIVNGKPMQLKHGLSAKSVFNRLFKYGNYRYPGQTIITNKEVENELRIMINKNSERFNGENVIVNPAGIPKFSHEEINAQFKRGLKSAKIDAMDILSDSNSQKKIALGLITSFCAIIGIGAIHEYREQTKNNIKGDPKNKRTNKAGKALSQSFKKNWKKGLIISAGFGVLILSGHLMRRQLLRPS